MNRYQMNTNMTTTTTRSTTPTTSSCPMTAAITSTRPMSPQCVKTAVAAASRRGVFFEPQAWHHHQPSPSIIYHHPPFITGQMAGSPSHCRAQMTTNWGLETHLHIESLGAYILLQDDQGGTGLEMYLCLEP